MTEDERKKALAALADAFERAAFGATDKLQAAMMIAADLRIAGYEIVKAKAGRDTP